MIAVLFAYTYNHGGGGSHAGTELAEHIYIIITSTQKVDNVIPNQVWLLV